MTWGSGIAILYTNWKAQQWTELPSSFTCLSVLWHSSLYIPWDSLSSCSYRNGYTHQWTMLWHASLTKQLSCKHSSLALQFLLIQALQHQTDTREVWHLPSITVRDFVNGKIYCCNGCMGQLVAVTLSQEKGHSVDHSAYCMYEQNRYFTPAAVTLWIDCCTLFWIFLVLLVHEQDPTVVSSYRQSPVVPSSIHEQDKALKWSLQLLHKFSFPFPILISFRFPALPFALLGKHNLVSIENNINTTAL